MNKPIQVRRVASIKDIGDASILYVGTDRRGELHDLLTPLAGRGLLVVSSEDAALAAGSTINLLVADQRVRFEVSSGSRASGRAQDQFRTAVAGSAGAEMKANRSGTLRSTFGSLSSVRGKLTVVVLATTAGRAADDDTGTAAPGSFRIPRLAGGRPDHRGRDHGAADGSGHGLRRPECRPSGISRHCAPSRPCSPRGFIRRTAISMRSTCATAPSPPRRPCCRSPRPNCRHPASAWR